MTTMIKAVYENGVFARSLTPLSLSEGQRVQVSVASEEPAQPQDAASILREIALLPVEGPSDPFTGRDHDRILYGSPHQP